MKQAKVWQCQECGKAWSQESRHTCPKCKSTDIDVYISPEYKLAHDRYFEAQITRESNQGGNGH